MTATPPIREPASFRAALVGDEWGEAQCRGALPDDGGALRCVDRVRAGGEKSRTGVRSAVESAEEIGTLRYERIVSGNLDAELVTIHDHPCYAQTAGADKIACKKGAAVRRE